MKCWLKSYTNQRLKNLKEGKCNIWAADLAEMESLSSKNRGVKYLLCAIDVFIKHALLKPLKDKKVKNSS